MHISDAIREVNEDLDEKLSACDGWDLDEDAKHQRVWSGLDLNEDDKKELAKKIVTKYQREFEILENYDKTRELPFQRKRIDITLSVETINKLKKLKEKTGKPVSQIIEEKF